MTENYSFSKRVTVGAFIVLIIAAGFYLLLHHGSFFLLVFSGILLAAAFCGITDWIEKKTGMKRGIALLLSVLLIFGILFAAFWFLAPMVGEQITQMQETIPKSINQVQAWLKEQSWGSRLVDKMPQNIAGALESQDNLAKQISGFFTTTFGILADLLIVIITALFLASNPGLYKKGLVKLFPVHKRFRISEVLQKCYDTLRMWLVGMLLAMAVIGVSTAIGFSLIGLPMALALAFIAFLFAFVPNIGPFLAGIPAVLIALSEGSRMAMYVVLIYGGIQLIESYVLTPIIFKKTVNLPPALLLFFQVLLGILQGGLGLLLAAPILAVLLVIVKELYVKDVLENTAASDAIITRNPGLQA